MSLLRFLPLLLSLPVMAQHFGQNKFQTERSHWRKVQTQHFDIYFDQHGDSIADWTAKNVENAYAQVSSTLGHQLYQRVPIILHNSPNHFRSTNVIPYALPEAVGGFTEIFQNRIVLPFDGSYNELRHVLQHEMVHAFMFDLFKGDGGSGGMRLAYKMDKIPLWFSEGLAEFASIGMDLESEPYLVDGISFGYLAPPSDALQGYMAYRGGQSYLNFLEQSYGKGTVQKLIKALKKDMDMDDALGSVTGIKASELGEIWLRELRRIYWPELGQRGYAKEFAHALTHPDREQSYTNLSPALSPDGRWIAFGSDQGGFEGIYASEIDSTGQLKKIKRIVSNAWAADHESVHLFNSGYTWSPDAQRLALVSQSHGLDQIQIVQASTGKILQRFELELDLIRNPQMSPDGKSLAFAGLQKGHLDLYLLDLERSTLRQLTFGAAAEDRPQFSHDGKSLLFESNQDFVNQGLGSLQKDPKQIYRMDLSTTQIQALSQGPSSHEQPMWGSGDSSIYYLSNQSGLNNIYRQDLQSGQISQVTNVLSQINSYSLDRSGKRLAFSLFEGGMFQLFLSDSIPQNTPSTHRTALALKLTDSSAPLIFPPRPRQLEAWKAPDALSDSCQILRLDSLHRICTLQSYDHALYSADSAILARQTQERRKILDSLQKSEIIQPALDSLGKLNPSPYRSQWNMDQMWLAAGGGYAGANRYSLGGEAYVHFSDLMGDQGITAMLYGSGSDWREISAYLQYAYLPYSNDFFTSLWYTPNRTSVTAVVDSNGQWLRGDPLQQKVQRQNTSLKWINTSGAVFDSIAPACIWYENGKAVDTTLQGAQGKCSIDHAFFDMDYGANWGISHPFSRFSRIDFAGGLSQIRRYQQNLVCLDSYCQKAQYQDSDLPSLELTRTQFSTEWNFDNSRWGWTGPMAGSRAYGSARWVKSLDGQDHYGVLSADMRHYQYLGQGFSIALRGAGGVSSGLGDGLNPYTFFVGGDDFFDLNYAQPNIGNTRGTLRESYSSEIDAPLRGFPYYTFRGSRYALANAELRFPLIQEIRLGFLPMSLGGIMGNVFYDVGGAWSRGNALDQMAWSWGWGWRVNLGVMVLRYTKAYGRYFAYAGLSDQTHVSLGADF